MEGLMAYNKICPICSTSFYCKKISSVFCSKKCRNRARSLPDELKMSLIKRSNLYVMKCNDHVAEVVDKHGRNITLGYEPEHITNENPLGEDAGLLLAQATLMKEARDNKQRAEQITIDDIPKEFQQDFQEQQKSLENEVGFSVVDAPTSQIQQQTTQYRIRKIGG
jgi:hypothetical protein